MYEYHCRYVRNYDGDTVTVDIDLGFGIWMKKQTIRLHGIDAPELRRPTLDEGRAAKVWLKEQLKGQKNLLLWSIMDRKGKYGRWLGYLHTDGFGSPSVNKLMVDAGYAVWREY